jgi:serine/threonine-protein kinase
MFLRRAGATPASFDTLPSEIAEVALKRLFIVSLFATGLALLNMLANVIIPMLVDSEYTELCEPEIVELANNSSMILFSLLFAWIIRRRKLSNRTLIRLGLAFEVLVALWITIGECTPLVAAKFHPITYYSFVLAWIVFFPAIVPIRSVATVVITLVVAVLPPLSRGLLDSIGWIELPEDSQALLITYMAFGALMGITISHVVYKLGKSVQAAREMGSYTLEENLGSGGMGEVWRASHRMLARPAAVKLIKPEVFIGMHPDEIDRMNKRFEQEVQATAALFSPHTVDIYDYGVASDGTFFYVMELLDGVDLETLIKKFGPVEASRAIHLLIQVCHSLDEAHKRRLIHRDIKPANLIVCHYGEDHDFVKVLDFGLVKLAAQAGKTGKTSTGDGKLAGTPAYMSPEMVSGKLPVDQRSDIYSLGCVAYWLLTGDLVFKAKTPMAMMAEHATAKPVQPSKVSEMEIPTELDELILSCLAKDPADRPPSIRQIKENLESIPVSQPWDEERSRNWWTLHHVD